MSNKKVNEFCSRVIELLESSYSYNRLMNNVYPIGTKSKTIIDGELDEESNIKYELCLESYKTDILDENYNQGLDYLDGNFYSLYSDKLYTFGIIDMCYVLTKMMIDEVIETNIEFIKNLLSSTSSVFGYMPNMSNSYLDKSVLKSKEDLTIEELSNFLFDRWLISPTAFIKLKDFDCIDVINKICN